MTLIGDKGINETFVLTKKDDEELGVGATLSKIVVPHPALQVPTAVEIIYTAYSGWITSGLKKWSIDRIKIGDSFGKSVSVCKKDLVLESGVSVMLKLYPGECNLPQQEAETTTIDPFFLPDSDNETNNTNHVIKTVDGYPAYTTENSTTKPNQTETPRVWRNEIVEPVLQPKKEESKQSLVKPRGISVDPPAGSDNESSWIPSVHLFPPPPGGKQLWETSREPKQFQSHANLPPTVKKGSGPVVTTLQNKMLNNTRNGSPRKRMYAYSSNKSEKSEGVVTVQLLPVQLANLLKQAEQYAKMSLFSPLDIFYRNTEKRQSPSEKRNLANETKVEEKRDNLIATPRSLDVTPKPKNLLPRIYEYFEKGLENVKSLFRWDGSDEQSIDTDGKSNATLVPYYYQGKETSDQTDKYIPLTAP